MPLWAEGQCAPLLPFWIRRVLGESRGAEGHLQALTRWVQVSSLSPSLTVSNTCSFPCMWRG